MFENRIAILPEETVYNILDTQQKILQLLQSKNTLIEPSTYCSVREAAQNLCVSEQKIRQMIDNDELKYKKFGRAIRIYRSCLI